MSQSQRGRLSIDVKDIRERVENCRDTPSWREMSLTQKLRVLILERLEEIEEENKKNA